MALARKSIRTLPSSANLWKAVFLAAMVIPMTYAHTVTGPIPGQPVLALGAFDLAARHYIAEEFFLSGNAHSYQIVGNATEEGLWNVQTAAMLAPYTTRLLVVRPTDPSKFNGTVVVEWLNVSAGADGAPDWSYTQRELIRSGYAYVGVSAQRAGIEGDGVLGIPGVLSIKKADPQRYSELNHPGDAFAYDIYTQAAKAIRGGGTPRLLGPLTPKYLLATGESQSAGYLTTYVDAIEPVARAFDGFLIHSRFGPGAPLEGAYIPAARAAASAALKIRSDLGEPVLIFITETDLMFPGVGYLQARQPDTDHLRTWEVAGTAHADTYILSGAAVDSGSEPIEVLARAIAPTRSVMGVQLEEAMNCAPQHHYVMVAALAALNRWVTEGTPPPHAPRLEVADSRPPLLALDKHGNAMGGVRSPWMDAPTARLSGLSPKAGGIGVLFGVTEPFDSDTLAVLYPAGKVDYLNRFEAALTAVIRAGFILPTDAAEIRALAAASFATISI
jgi:hypothetical protein